MGDTTIGFCRTNDSAKISVVFPFRASTADTYEQRMHEDLEDLYLSRTLATDDRKRRVIDAIITLAELADTPNTTHYHGNEDIKERFYTAQEREAVIWAGIKTTFHGEPPSIDALT
jgi:hypothetical protein